MSAMDWAAALANSSRGDHLCQAYRDEGFLAEAVVAYLAAGLRSGAQALVIATPAHRSLFETRLAEAAPGTGTRLLFLDAEETLGKFRIGGLLDWQRFRDTIGRLLDGLDSGRTPRLYGEMVDLLWQRGERHSAMRLEAYWNRLAESRAFSLLCAYRIDVTRPELYGGPLEGVCAAHTHFIPARDYARFDSAVLTATERVLDPAAARMLMTVSARWPLAACMPLGQAMLLWLREHMPRTCASVLRELAQRRSQQAL